ncbi:toxin-antitoxin system YwqK family antitoxin [Rubritalea tangerina]|uniref:Toxin-antitoxin system YwqK family antitoxin n=1 Tax=Rubritalea tangerina TaxID=430798 RepID=A0ABW4Z7T3_9BACT
MKTPLGLSLIITGILSTLWAEEPPINTDRAKNSIQEVLLHYPSGQLREKYFLKKNKKHGVHTSFDKDGNIITQTQYLRGHPIGIIKDRQHKPQTTKKTPEKSIDKNKTDKSIEFHPNGQIKRSGSFLKGKKHGLFSHWNSEGQKTYEITYSNGKRHGKFTRWFDQKRIQTGYYADNKLHGTVTSWNHGNTKKSEVNYFRGQKTRAIEFSENNIVSETRYQHNKKHGIAKTWNPNGRKASMSHYQTGQLQGLKETWHSNGRKASQENYVNNRRHGKAQYWIYSEHSKTYHYEVVHFNHGHYLRTVRNGKSKKEPLRGFFDGILYP